MRKLALMVALASTAIAAPAVARDNTGYIGVEGGGMVLEDMRLRADTGTNFYPEAAIVDFHNGVDVDLIAGYDFGAVRLEGELGYKRASVDAAKVDPGFSALGATLYNADGHARSLSGMVNGLVDFGDKDEGGWSGYVGAGIGLADVSAEVSAPPTRLNFSDSDTKLAYQFLAGVRTAISDNVDLGVKYRHFRTKSLDFESNGILYQGKWRSHSLLASLIFNFAAPPPPPVVCPDGTELPAGSSCPVAPPPPPPPPQTQTCPDGSVILASETCPPPPPPPPPPAEPERG